jgi:hypothetical protein
MPPNERLALTAPLGGRSGNVGVEAAASRSPFGAHRRRSSSAVFDALSLTASQGTHRLLGVPSERPLV